MNIEKDLGPLKEVLHTLRKEGKLLAALLYGSFAKGTPHKRSDIDLAVFINARNVDEDIDITDKILMSTEREVSILRLDDDEESPFVVQEALKGTHLVEPDVDTLYNIAHRALHESESIRFRRSINGR